MKMLSLIAVFALTLLASHGIAQENPPPSVSAEAVKLSKPGEVKAPVAVAVTDGAAKLSPENSKVEFVGTHVGDEPKPRLGGFEKFSGNLEVEAGTPKALMLEFATGSLWTELGGSLTDHLKTADFLDVENHPTAKFVSKSISQPSDEGVCEIVGDFTLMGMTNEIKMPAEIKMNDDGVMLKSEFKLDRTSFGMSKMTDRVSKDVAITLSIGEQTVRPQADATPLPERPARRGGMDVAAMFKNADKDGDGKLTGDEIPARIKNRMEAFDTDKDGAISLAELQSRTPGRPQARPGQEGGGGNRGGGGEKGANRGGGDGK